jgi:mono/diheme cytochrome c family protein
MNIWARRAGVAAVIVVLIGTIAVLAAKKMGENKMQRQVGVNVKPVRVAMPHDTEWLERGRYLFMTRGCAECHGATGGGKEVVNDGGMLVVAPNITLGDGSAVKGFRPVDWVRVLRHGVKRNDKVVMIMPSEDYNQLTDEDMGALVGYAMALPPVSGKSTIIELPLPVLALYGVGAIQDAYEKIDHKKPAPPPIKPSVTPAYGAYLANACIGCHGDHLGGGKVPGGPPSWPAAANLTPGKGSAMLRYPDAESFIAMFKSGKRPDGSAINEAMPFAMLGAMTEDDMRALHAYLKGLAPRELGSR